MVHQAVHHFDQLDEHLILQKCFHSPLGNEIFSPTILSAMLVSLIINICSFPGR